MRVLATIALVIGAVALPAAGAAAKSKAPKPTVVGVKRTVEGIAAGSVVTVAARCPKRYRILSGGYSVGGTPYAHVSGAAITSKNNSYTAIVVNPPANPSIGQAGQAEASAVAACARSGVPVIVDGGFPLVKDTAVEAGARVAANDTSDVAVAKAVDLPAGEVATGTAYCPKNFTAISGGYILKGESVFAHGLTTALASSSGSFKAAAVNPPGNPSLGLPAQSSALVTAAFCVRDKYPIVLGGGDGSPSGKKTTKRTVIRVAEPGESAAPGEAAVAEAKCPDGYRVISGDFRILGESVSAYPSAASTSSKRNSYIARVVNPVVQLGLGFVESQTVRLAVTALCAKEGRPIIVNGKFPLESPA